MTRVKSSTKKIDVEKNNKKKTTTDVAAATSNKKDKKDELEPDMKDNFDKNVPINLKSDICAFCKQGHDFGLLLKMKSVNPEEVADSEMAPAFANTHQNVLDVEAVWASRFSLVGKARRFVHFHCALNSPQCWLTVEGVWNCIGKEIHRGNGLACTSCGRKGATLGCKETRCRHAYHVPCAIELGFSRTRYLCEYLCPTHNNETTKKVKNHKRTARPIQRSEDISMGQERIAIPVVSSLNVNHNTSSSSSSSMVVVDLNTTNDVVEEQEGGGAGMIFPDFRYCRDPIDSNDVTQNLRCLETTDCCTCTDGMCFDVNQCACLRDTGKNYALNGSLLPGVTNRIVECNFRCQCNSRRCSNRVVQRGLVVPMEVFAADKRDAKGGDGRENTIWGVRCTEDILAGSFVCIVSGQVVLGGTIPRSIAQRDDVQDSTSVLEYFYTQQQQTTNNKKKGRRELGAVPIAAWEEQEGGYLDTFEGTALDWAKNQVEKDREQQQQEQQSEKPLWGGSSSSNNNDNDRVGAVVGIDSSLSSSLSVGQLASDYLKGQICVSILSNPYSDYMM